MVKKKNKGGKRKGAGRKPVKDKKQVVTLYVRKSKIRHNGGEETLKKKLYKTIDDTDQD